MDQEMEVADQDVPEVPPPAPAEEAQQDVPIQEENVAVVEEEREEIYYIIATFGEDTSRVLAPEREISYRLKFICRNRDFGCNFSGNYNEVYEHQNVCQEDMDTCPLKPYTHCEDNILHEYQFLRHCRYNHPGLKFAINGKCSLWENFTNLNITNNKLSILILAYGELFYSLAEVDLDRNIVQWTVYYLGDPQELHRYVYEVDFHKTKVSNICHSLRNKCQRITRPNVTFTEDCSTIFYQTVKEICSTNDLIYFVRIQKHETT